MRDALEREVSRSLDNGEGANENCEGRSNGH